MSIKPWVDTTMIYFLFYLSYRTTHQVFHFDTSWQLAIFVDNRDNKLNREINSQRNIFYNLLFNKNHFLIIHDVRCACVYTLVCARAQGGAMLWEHCIVNIKHWISDSPTTTRRNLFLKPFGEDSQLVANSRAQQSQPVSALSGSDRLTVLCIRTRYPFAWLSSSSSSSSSLLSFEFDR